MLHKKIIELMSNPELIKYISAAREKKVTDDLIKIELVKHGWPEREVVEALNPTQSISLDLPPPPVPQFSMWITFQYFILFISLYVTASSIAGMLHYLVDTKLPDPVVNNRYNMGYVDDYLLKMYIAGLSVGFPIFAGLFLSVNKQIIDRPAIRNLPDRKKLIYGTLGMTFVIMIGHLIFTIYAFLNGTTTVRSFGHLGVTFLVAGSIFLYLLHDVREDRKVV